MKYCIKTLLVGIDHELPDDPSISYDGKEPFVGCNHLVCDNCGAVVHHADGRSTTSNNPRPAAEMQALYDSSDPCSSPLFTKMVSDQRSRAYFCRCNWHAADLGGVVFVARIDAPWSCGGHEGAAMESVARIRLNWAANVSPAFATASELRDSLLSSYPDAARYGAPLVGRNLEDTAPAWGWVSELLRSRTDWWPPIGIALQHATTDGGDLARTALVELLAHFTDSIALLPWTAPMAVLWPDRRTIHTAATGWGGPDYRLDAVIRSQREYTDVVCGNRRAFLHGYGVDGAPIIGPLTNEAELRALLVSSARAGQSPDGDKGPWSWLTTKLLLRGETWLWVRPAFLHIASTIDQTDQAMVCALLDWFTEEHDLWQFLPLLESWNADRPSWWNTPADTKPTAWKRTVRAGFWPNVKTFGDAASEARKRARCQVATPPVIDLPLLYGTAAR